MEDLSHTPHRPQTAITPVKESNAVAQLKRPLLVTIHGLLAAAKSALNLYASYSGLHRCLRRHGVGNLQDLTAKVAKPKHSFLIDYKPGYIHVDLKYLMLVAAESDRRYLSLQLAG